MSVRCHYHQNCQYLTKEHLASQECVGGNARRQAPSGARRTPVSSVSVTESEADRPNGKESSDVEAHEVIVGSELRAQIKMVDRCPWSPRVYRSLRLLGKTLCSVGKSVCSNLSLLSNNL
jgi:hypothetical protein